MNKEQNPFLKGAVDTYESPRNLNFGYITGNRKQSEEPDANYLDPSKSPFASHMYISFIFIYDPYYSRFVRCLALVTSLCIQNFIAGIIIYLFSDLLSLPNNGSILDGFTYLTYVSGSSGLVIAIISEIVGEFLKFVMKNNVYILKVSDSGKMRARSKFWRVFGITLCLGLIGFMVFGVYFIAVKVYTPHVVVWFYIVIIALVFDMLIIQNTKALIKCIRNRKNPMLTVVPEMEPEKEKIKEKEKEKETLKVKEREMERGKKSN